MWWNKAITNQIIQLSRSNATIDTRDNLLSDGNGVYVVHVKAITQSRNSCCDLVELYTLLASI